MLKGISVSEGIGIGKAYIVSTREPVYTPVCVTDTEAEYARFEKAVEVFCRKTEELACTMEQSVEAKEAAIIRGHIQMLTDPYMLSQIEEQIKDGTCAESACENILNTFIEMFSQVDDELTRQRATDVQDIKIRMLKILLNEEEHSLQDIPPQSILITEDLTPSMTAEMKKEHVTGIVTEKGGRTSHSAILARALEIPAVLSAEGALKQIKDGDTVVVDGGAGTVISQPREKELADYREKQKAYEEEKKLLRQYIGKATATADGQKKAVCCNIGNPRDAITAAEKDGEGIGLFRTEFLFMDKAKAPSEEEQFAAYKKVAEVFKGKEVIIRTLDVGGDKGIPYLKMEQEDNPFLGFRAVRYCLEHQELYDTQLRAIIRASAFGHIKIMVPLVTNVEEIRAAKKRVQIITREFDETGVEYDRNLQIGIMAETPAASLIADLLAKECDFFSIGTNDLTQYTMAADRGNAQVGYLNTPYDPAVLRSICRIIRCGKEAGIPVGMCGEAAADPLLTPLLLAFGLDEFSVNPASVLATRYQISRWTQSAAEKMASQVMELETAEAVENFLNKRIIIKEDVQYDKDCD